MHKLKNSWDGTWPRYDPNRGYLLCEKCWNGQHTVRDVRRCTGGGCGCGCTDPGPRKKRFTAEGQTAIPMDNALHITTKS